MTAKSEVYFPRIDTARGTTLVVHRLRGQKICARIEPREMETLTTGDLCDGPDERQQAARFDCAARMIRDGLRLSHSDRDYHYALARARRVIEHGGTLSAAVNHAIGDELLA